MHYYCAPSYLINYFKNDINLCYSLRSGKSKNFVFKLPFTEFYKHSFAYSGIQLWNNLSESVKLASTIESFKHKCKLYISHNVTMSLVKVFSTDCFIYMYNYNCDCEGLLIVFYTKIGNPFLNKLLLSSLLFLKVYTTISHFPILSMFI